MPVVLADIASGEVDWADVLFLVGFILFLVATVIAVIGRVFETALIAGGLAAVSLAWLLLYARKGPAPRGRRNRAPTS